MTLILAELLKLRTTRMVYALLGALLLIVALFTVLAVFATPRSELAQESEQGGIFGSAATGIIFLLLLGVMLLAGEYRHGTITQTFLITPIRWKIVAAKLAAAAVLGFVYGVVAEIFALFLAVPLLEIRGVDFMFGDEGRNLLVGTVTATTLCAPFGVAIACVIRNQIVAIITVFAGLLVVEPLVSTGLSIRWPTIPKFFPLSAIGGVIGDDPEVFDREWSALILLGYIALLSVLGTRFVLSRDVNSIQA